MNRVFSAVVLASLSLCLTGCPGKKTPQDQTQPANATSKPTQSNTATTPKQLTVYCGRSESLVKDLLSQFEKATGIKVTVSYAKTTAMALKIKEEGANCSADVFFAQDAGALGLLGSAGLLNKLDAGVLQRTESRFQSQNGDWVGVSGRARVLAYSTERVKAEDLPKTIWDLTDKKWKGKIGWPPKNASFKAFVTALRAIEGEQKAEEWLQKIQANEPKVYPKNTPIIAAIASGEVDVGLVNHYYLHRFLKEKGDKFPVRNYHFQDGGPGSLINVAGVATLKSGKNQEAAKVFVDYLLSSEAQEYFASKTNEYPLAKGSAAPKAVIPMTKIKHPNFDLNKLESLAATEKLLFKLKILK